MGSKKVPEAKAACRDCIDILDAAGFNPRDADHILAPDGTFRITNVMGTTNVNSSINLNRLVAAHPNHAFYDPNFEPPRPLEYRMDGQNAGGKLALVYWSGSIAFLGFNDFDDLKTRADAFIHVVRPHFIPG